MIDISRTKVKSLLDKFEGRRIIVLGDLMLDRYIEGGVSRISPEAPVPVVEVKSEFMRLGGAANVARNLASLGAVPISVGVIGKDQAGADFLSLMDEHKFMTDFIAADDNRPTVVKTRIIADGQQVVRADWESKQAVSQLVQQKILNFLKKNVPDSDAIIIEDYNKGLLSPELIKRTINLSRAHNKIITVDPKFSNFFQYKNVSLFKPNRKEIEAAFGILINSTHDLETACLNLMERIGCKYLLVTLGERGMCLLDSKRNFSQIPTRAQKVHDVSGAGDTVISTLTLAMASGTDIKVAVSLANYAAGVVCGEVGVVPITPEKLLQAIQFF
ncbi:MAG: D-glycero-beta-D-manno-heptose-7-phosphate kinase [bacterium]|nr:D-glycero-beta-D-manno-heptose-7-phosphate kinase [bacterium]